MRTTFADFGAEVLRARIDAMLRHADGVRDRDVEALHDMRVASRRLRAALTVFEPAFADPEYADLEREVKAVTRALGAARDLDVMALSLTKLQKALPPDERDGLLGLLETAEARRRDAQPAVEAALVRLAQADIAAQLDRICTRLANQRRWMAQADLARGNPGVPGPKLRNGGGCTDA